MCRELNAMSIQSQRLQRIVLHTSAMLNTSYCSFHHGGAESRDNRRGEGLPVEFLMILQYLGRVRQITDQPKYLTSKIAQGDL